jgi:hypothetical protein
VALWRKDADQGDADAQTALGEAYDKGRGAPQDDAQAAAWWRKAAEQGNASAQNNLGEAYEHGRSVPQDYVRALVWFSLAVSGAPASDRDKMVKNRDDVAAKMTPAQIAEAQLTAREWRRGTEANIAVDKVAKQTALGVFRALFTAAVGVFQALFTGLWVMLCFLFVLYIFLFGFVIPPIGFGLYYGSRLIRNKPWAARVRFFGLVFLYGQERFKPERKAAIYHWRRERALKLLEPELDVLVRQRDAAWLQEVARREALARTPIPPERLKALIVLAHPDRHNGSKVATETTQWLLAQRVRKAA